MSQLEQPPSLHERANVSTFEIAWNCYVWEEGWIMEKGFEEETTLGPTSTCTTKIRTRYNKWIGHLDQHYPVHRIYRDHHSISKNHIPSRPLSTRTTHVIHCIPEFSICSGLVLSPINHTWPSLRSCSLRT